MPFPTPNLGEGESAFMSRIVKFLEQENESLPEKQKRNHKEMIAIGLSQWRDFRKQHQPPKLQGIEGTFGEIAARLDSVKEQLLATFGEWGETIFYFTLKRLGAWNDSAGYLSTMTKADLQLPFMKTDPDGNIEFGNLILGETNFTKIDPDTHTVEGYAISCVADNIDDLMFPESYQDSLQTINKAPFLMHDTNIVTGKNLFDKIDQIGWYVKDQIDEKFWGLVEDGTLKGFSTAGGFVMHPKRVGAVNVYDRPHSVKVLEHSLVTNPCNKLAFFQTPKEFAKTSESSLTVLPNVNGDGCGTDVSAVSSAKLDNNTQGNENLPENPKPPTNQTPPAPTVVPPVTPPAPTKPLEEMTSEELMAQIEKNAEAKVQKKLVATVKLQEKQAAEAAEENRINNVITELAKEKARADEMFAKNEQLSAKVAIITEKLDKLGNTTEQKPINEGNSHAPNEIEKVMTLATKADHQTAWNAVESLVKKKMDKQN